MEYTICFLIFCILHGFLGHVSASKEEESESSNKSGLTAGVVIIYLITCAVVGAAAFFLWRRFMQRKNDEDQVDCDEIHLKFDGPWNDAKPDLLPYQDKSRQNAYFSADTPVAVVKPITNNRKIAVKEIHDVLKQISLQELQDEYKNLPKDQIKEWSFAKQPALVPKNKFKNILPYDDNRVVLEQEGDNPLTQYINASYIQGYGKQKQHTYIACQGPQKTTIEDFWRMIWQCKVFTIVMLTNLVEKMKTKCYQYWPEGERVSYGGVEISVEKEENLGDIVIRHLKATKGPETRHIRQFHYVGWPDHGAPESTRTIIELRNEVRKCQRKHTGHPTAVHCSAGVGRTGTYISIDYLLDEADDTHSVDVVKCVHGLRCARVNMVQSFDQYRFIYNTLDEHLTLGGTEIKTQECHKILSEILSTKDGQSTIRRQYQFLEDMKPVYAEDEMQIALNNGNTNRNRDLTVIPADKHCLALESEDGNGGEYINAIELEGFKDKCGYVVTQVPLAHTRNDFWRLLMENNIQNVVYMKESVSCDDTWLPNKGNGLEFGTMSAVCTDAKRVGAVEVLQITVSRQSAASTGDLYANVKQEEDVYANMAQPNTETMQVMFHVHSSIDVHGDASNASNSLIALQNIVLGNAVAGQPTAVMCLNGAKDSGIFIACDIISKMIAHDPKLDIFNTVQLVRPKRPQFIHSFEQYTFLYKFANTCTDSLKLE